MNTHTEKLTLGSYLKAARSEKNFSVAEVARRAGSVSPLSVLKWERNQGSALPLPVLHRLIEIYDLDAQLVLDLLLRYQLSRIEEKFLQLQKRVR